MSSEIATWLSALGLDKYDEVFEEHEVDFEVLPELNEDDLKDMGLPLGPRKKLLKAIAALEVSLAPSQETAPQPADPSLTMRPLSGERRQVTVLFADLCGFSTLSRERDAEEVHQLLNSYFEVVDGVVESFGGAVDKHIGDAVMAVFGAPIAYGDDAERAVRAALEIHRAVAALEPPLESHIGVASGQVVARGTGSQTHEEYTVTGESVNLAARLHDLARPGETLISQALFDELDGQVEATRLEATEVEGWDSPVPYWRLAGMKTKAAVPTQRSLVGRHGELAQLSAALKTCQETGTGQTILVRGEPGIGKTRLLDEFEVLASAAGITCHSGLVLDFGTGKGQDAIRALTRSLLNIPPGSAKAVRQAAAARAVEAGLMDELYWPHLNDLLDLEQPLEFRSIYDAMDNATRNKGKEEAVCELVRRLSATAPLLLRIEDLHWADSLVLGHVAALTRVAVDCPIVLVLTSRLEGALSSEVWNSSTAGVPLATLDLGPIRGKEAQLLAADYGIEAGRYLDECIERAGGNPLFLDQLLRGATALAVGAVPGSVQSVVQARADALQPEDKLALQAASIMGQRFSLDALRAVVNDPSYDCASLIRNALIRPQGDGFLFAHALVREAVYGSLLSGRKKELHNKAADWFAGQDSTLAAEHMDMAGHSGAPRAYLEAGQQQAEIYRNARAIALAERGLAIVQERADKFALTHFLGERLLADGQNEQALQLLREALDLAEERIERCRAHIGVAAALRITDELKLALEHLEEAELEATSGGENLDYDLSRLYHLRGNLCFPLGRIEDCKKAHQKALDYARRVGSPELEAHALGGIGDAEYARGHMVTAQEYFGECIAIAQAKGLGSIEAANLNMIGGGGTLHYCNDLSGALETTGRGVDLALRTGQPRAQILALMGAAQITMDQNELEAADEYVVKALDLAEIAGLKRLTARTLGHGARIKLYRGNRSDAAEFARRGAALSRETGSKYCGPTILSVLIAASDDVEEVESAIAEATVLLDEGCVSHNYFEYYSDMIDYYRRREDWEKVEACCAFLEDYTKEEPLPRTDYFIRRGRALSRFVQGDKSETVLKTLHELRKQGAEAGLHFSLRDIDNVLAQI